MAVFQSPQVSHRRIGPETVPRRKPVKITPEPAAVRARWDHFRRADKKAVAGKAAFFHDRVHSPTNEEHPAHPNRRKRICNPVETNEAPVMPFTPLARFKNHYTI